VLKSHDLTAGGLTKVRFGIARDEPLCPGQLTRGETLDEVCVGP